MSDAEFTQMLNDVFDAIGISGVVCFFACLIGIAMCLQSLSPRAD